MDLRDAVLQIANHFQTQDSTIGKVVRTDSLIVLRNHMRFNEYVVQL